MAEGARDVACVMQMKLIWIVCRGSCVWQSKAKGACLLQMKPKGGFSVADK